MSRFLKKYSHKYEFLKLELEEFQEQFEDYETEWKELFAEYFNNIKQEVWINEETGEISNEPPDKKKSKPKIDTKVKKLYRKASTIAHPDKGGDPEEFNKVKKYYENNDYIGLLNYASQNNIDVKVEAEDKALLENSCRKLQEDINKIRSTLIWNFFNGSLAMKKGVIVQLEKDHNIKIDAKDILNKLENSE